MLFSSFGTPIINLQIFASYFGKQFPKFDTGMTNNEIRFLILKKSPRMILQIGRLGNKEKTYLFNFF